jgi:hypothetical protein
MLASAVVLIVGLGLAFLLLGGTVASLQVRIPDRAEPIMPPAPAEPAQNRRLAFEDLVYQGAFRVPSAEPGDTFSYGGQTLAYNPASNTLFISSLKENVAELSIPSPVKADRLDQLPVASVVQPFRDPTDGRLHDISEHEVKLGGLLVHDTRLYASGYIYYDAGHTQRLTHFSRSLDLSRPEVQRIHQVGETGKAGFVAGYMAPVPVEWQTALGGPAVTGQCCIPIVGRTSFGPSLFSWNPADLGRRDPVPVTPLLYYNEQHPTLGSWEGSKSTYGGTTQIAGVAIIEGTRTVLFPGRTGLGEFCYGSGTDDPRKAKERGPNGETYCYDPTNSYKGQHAYPYRLQFWAYDVTDLAAVRLGKKEPWDVVPYAIWPFELPSLGEPQPLLGRLAYDARGRRLFISELFAEHDVYARRPIIHVYVVRR